MKTKINNTIKLNSYNIISDAVEMGINYGYMRAHKYNDKPTEQDFKAAIQDGIMNSLSEVIDYGNE